MKVGLFQFAVVFVKKSVNLHTLYRALQESEFDLMVLPELFATGSLFTSRKQLHELAEPVPTGETTQALLQIAKARHACLVGSLVEQDGSHVYNTAVVVTPQGIIGKHRKVHLSDQEMSFFEPGSDFLVFAISGIRVGVLLCYDSWFPEASRRLRQQGAQLICHPANFCGEDSLAVIRERAREQAVYIITANRLGMDHDNDLGISFLGASQIASPKGEVFCQAGREEALIVQEIDLGGPPRKEVGFGVEYSSGDS